MSMNKFFISTIFKPANLLLVVCLTSPNLCLAQTSLPAQTPEIVTTYKDGATKVSMAPLKISDAKDEYRSLHVALSFKYEGQTPMQPDFIQFELQTVVKKRSLNPDLYIVFLVDGEKIHLGSSRWGVKSPIPGRRSLGERISMRMPLATFLKIVKSEQAEIRMAGTLFVIGAEQKAAMLELTRRM
jgi:hypothetical protein